LTQVRRHFRSPLADMSHIREGLAVLRSFPQTGTSLVLEGDAVSFVKLTFLVSVCFCLLAQKVELGARTYDMSPEENLFWKGSLLV
jgi:hypothetical protein